MSDHKTDDAMSDHSKLRAAPKASHFINGEYVEDTSGEKITCVYPANNEIIAEVHCATAAVIEHAVDSAGAAQVQWMSFTPAERGRVLRRAADIIREANREISELETLSTGKPLSETLVADATTAADALEYFGGLAGSLTGDYIDLGGDFAYTRREPLGICAGLGAWNYPIQIAGWKAAPALACGNSMVFKPSEQTPLAALKLAEILMEAGAPAGLFNVIQGAGEVGHALASHGKIAKISLTGSVPTGRKVASVAAGTMKSVTMELGGKSPLIIFDDADIDRAIDGAVIGNFFATGQVCSNGTRVFVQDGIYDEFVQRITAKADSIRIGDPLDEETEMGPQVSVAQRDIVLRYIEQGESEGAIRTTQIRDLPSTGAWISPVVFAQVQDHMTIAREEIFGPVMSVLRFSSEEEVIARANDTDLGLSAGVYTSDIDRAHRVAKLLQAGSLWINAYNLTPVEVPFGGVKQSGVGRENSRAAIEHYSQLKSIYVGMT